MSQYDGSMGPPRRIHPLTGFAWLRRDLQVAQEERAFAIRADEYQEQQDESKFNELLSAGECRLVLDVACALVQIGQLQASHPVRSGKCNRVCRGPKP